MGGGHTGQEVSLFSMYNHEQNQVEQIWSGCTDVGGKLSSDVTKGTKQRMKLFFKLEDQQLDGICADSVQ